MFKKLVLSFSLFFGFLVMPAQAMAATLALTPAAGNANRGCNLSLQVIVDTQAANTDGTDAVIFYDPARMSITPSAITTGTIYQEYPAVIVDSPTKGVISISGISNIGQPFSGKGTLATLNFKILENAPAGATTIKFDFDPNDKAKSSDSNVATRTDTNIVDLLSAVTDGSYTVGTGSCALGQGQTGLTSSATPSATQKPVFVPSALPEGGIEGPTMLIVVVGTFLTVLGIAGLALL